MDSLPSDLRAVFDAATRVFFVAPVNMLFAVFRAIRTEINTATAEALEILSRPDDHN